MVSPDIGQGAPRDMNVDPRIFCGIPAPDTPAFTAMVAFCEWNASALLSSGSFIFCELAGRIGFDATLRLMYERGGSKLYISDRLTTIHGREVTAKLAEKLIALGGDNENIVIPSCWGFFTRARSLAIHDALKSMSAPKVANVFGVHERSIHRLKSSKS